MVDCFWFLPTKFVTVLTRSNTSEDNFFNFYMEPRLFVVIREEVIRKINQETSRIVAKEDITTVRLHLLINPTMVQIASVVMYWKPVARLSPIPIFIKRISLWTRFSRTPTSALFCKERVIIGTWHGLMDRVYTYLHVLESSKNTSWSWA